MKTLKTFCLILSLCLAINANAYDVCIDRIYYNLVPETKQASVTSGDSYYTGSVVIPEKITTSGVEYSVTSIGEEAFKWCDLTSIDIPNSVTSIGNHAFGYTSLTSIDIPNSVTSIGNYAFYFCGSLTSIDIPNSVTSIGRGAFSSCM